MCLEEEPGTRNQEPGKKKKKKKEKKRKKVQFLKCNYVCGAGRKRQEFRNVW